jgi:hypothetical protein
MYVTLQAKLVCAACFVHRLKSLHNALLATPSCGHGNEKRLRNVRTLQITDKVLVACFAYPWRLRFCSMAISPCELAMTAVSYRFLSPKLADEYQSPTRLNRNPHSGGRPKMGSTKVLHVGHDETKRAPSFWQGSLLPAGF